MADPGGYEGGRQASLLGLPDLPGRPIRRSGGGLCPAVLRRTEADGGVSTHPAPAVCCCLHPTAGCSPSVCSSPRAPSCCLRLRSSSATTAACTTAAAWSWPQETGAARLRPCQAREAPEQAASLRPARSESGPSQAPVQDVDAETHLSMRPSPRLVCSNRPEGRLLPCLDPPSTQTVSPLCVRGASIPVQGPSLRAIPVASCLHQGRRSRPCTVKGSRHSYPQLP